MNFIKEIMMKHIFHFLLISTVLFTALSCSKTKSYEERLRDEQKIIDRFMDEKGFVVIDDFPADGKFESNEFVILESGVYLNIIDYGNLDQMAEYSVTDIIARFSYALLETAYEYSNYGPHSNGTTPLQFKYGYWVADRGYSAALECFSQGMQEALEYVGDGGIVRLILPFRVASYYASQSYIPEYFDVLQYKFLENL